MFIVAKSKMWQVKKRGRGGESSLGVVTRGDEEVGEHCELVIREHLFVVLPIVVVSAFELRQRRLHGYLNNNNNCDVSEKVGKNVKREAHLYWLRIVDMRAEIHEHSRNERRNIVRKGAHACAQSQHTRVTSAHFVSWQDFWWRSCWRQSATFLDWRSSETFKVPL